jgi:hypothetical protein
MNPALVQGQTGTGALGGWESSEMRSYLKDTIKSLMPAEIQSALKNVIKKTDIYVYNSDEAKSEKISNATSVDDIWIPSAKEIMNSGETEGVIYPLFDSVSTRSRYRTSGVKASIWTRSASSESLFKYIGSDWSVSISNSNTTYYYIDFGFCL